MSLFATPPTALELAAKIRKRDVSVREVTLDALERIQSTNPELNAFVEICNGSAVRAAEKLDGAADEQRRSPLFGVPTGIKDLHPMRGTFTRMGSRAFRYLYTPFDDPIVSSVRQGGCVITGKLATSEMGLMPTVETEIHPPTRNPVNLGFTAGGSSGGSVAAVASGLLPLAPGSDGGGSIRIPAAFCGVVGFKPSRGVVQNPAAAIDANDLAAVGPLARTVEDAAAMLDILSCRGPDAPHSFLSTLRVPGAKVRVKVCVDPPFGKTDPELREAVLDVAKKLERLGHHVEVVPPVSASTGEFFPIYTRMFANAPVVRESCLQPMTRWFRQQGKSVTAAEAEKAAKALEAKVLDWLAGVDVVLTPTTPSGPPRIGQFDGMQPEDIWEQVGEIGVFTAGFNVGGQPAISLPIGNNREGLPMGAQVVGQVGADGLVLALALQLEQEFGGFDPLS